MKKIKILLSLFLIIFIIGCEPADKETETSHSTENNAASESISESISESEAENQPVYLKEVMVYGLSEYKALQEMVENNDEEKLEKFYKEKCRLVETREDLIKFLDMLESISVLKLSNYEIGLIRYVWYGDAGHSVYIKAKAPNGDRFDIAYRIHFKDIEEIANLWLKNDDKVDWISVEDIQSEDGRIKAYLEANKHYEEANLTLDIVALSVDGVFATIHYNTNKYKDGKKTDIISDLEITSIEKLLEESGNAVESESVTEEAAQKPA